MTVRPLSLQNVPSTGARLPVIDWIDRELADTYAISSGFGGNCLLELRQAFCQGSANAFVAKFYRLLPKLESTHFLLGYRIRQWIALHYELLVSDPLERVSARTYPIRFNESSLPSPRNTFFEHAEEAIPLSDIRVQIRRKALV